MIFLIILFGIKQEDNYSPTVMFRWTPWWK